MKNKDTFRVLYAGWKNNVYNKQCILCNVVQKTKAKKLHAFSLSVCVIRKLTIYISFIQMRNADTFAFLNVFLSLNFIKD